MLSITINGVQIREYLKNYECIIEEVYDEEDSFVAIDGTVHKAFLGDRRKLRVEFESMDTEQINTLFQAIRSNRNVSINYIDPQLGRTTRGFSCPSLPAATYFEGETTKGTKKQYWTVPTIEFVEPELDKERVDGESGGGGGGGGGGEDVEYWSYSVMIPGVGAYTESQIEKGLKMSMSLSSNGFDVGQIAIYSLSGNIYVGESSAGAVSGGQVFLYAGLRGSESLNLLHIFYLKDANFTEDGKYLSFTAYDCLSFLDNEYTINYEYDAEGKIIPQTVFQHRKIVEDMVAEMAGTNSISFPADCDNIILNPEETANAKTLIQNIASSTGTNYRQSLGSSPVSVEAFSIGSDIVSLSDIREPVGYGYVNNNTIQTVVLYCGATTKMPHKIDTELSEFNKMYNIYFAGTVPASGLLNPETTLEVIAPYYGISADQEGEEQGGRFNSLLGKNFGTSFNCPKVKVSTLFPIGAKIAFEGSGNIDMYATNVTYNFEFSGIYADISCEGRGAVSNNYLGQMQNQMYSKISLDSTYNNILIDSAGIKFAAPKYEEPEPGGG